MAQKDKEIYCRDIGIDYDLMVCGKTEEETLSKLGQYVLAIHGIEGNPPFSKRTFSLPNIFATSSLTGISIEYFTALILTLPLHF